MVFLWGEDHYCAEVTPYGRARLNRTSFNTFNLLFKHYMYTNNNELDNTTHCFNPSPLLFIVQYWCKGFSNRKNRHIKIILQPSIMAVRIKSCFFDLNPIWSMYDRMLSGKVVQYSIVLPLEHKAVKRRSKSRSEQ